MMEMQKEQEKKAPKEGEEVDLGEAMEEMMKMMCPMMSDVMECHCGCDCKKTLGEVGMECVEEGESSAEEDETTPSPFDSGDDAPPCDTTVSVFLMQMQMGLTLMGCEDVADSHC
jgi:hypothetical protein